MKTFTIEEAINDMASSASVAHGNGYCTWICSAHIGYQRRGYDDEYAEGQFTTHDESWKNENNYESTEDRNRRIAKEIFYSWEHEEAPDNVFICREKDIVIVLTNDEYNFISHKADDEGDYSYFESLCDGCTTKFVNDYNKDWESEE